MNEIVKLTGGTLTELQAAIAEEMAGEGDAFDLQPARIKIAPGGIGQFMLGDEASKSFTGVVAVSQKVRGYWPGAGVGSPPLCSSADGRTGICNPDPDGPTFEAAIRPEHPHPGIMAVSNNQPVEPSYRCSHCPMNQWGSEHQRRGGAGRGKACKEMRRLLILPDGWSLPAVMSLPPTSLQAWDAYCSSLQARGSAYFAVRTKFALDAAQAAGGETYNVVQVSAAGDLDEPQVRLVGAIREQYRTFVTGMPVEAEEYEAPVTGASTDDDRLPPF